MARQSRNSKKPRRRFAEEYKSEALALAGKVGVSEASEQLTVQPSQLYAWRSKAQLLQCQGQVEQKLVTENARLKRVLAEKEQEVAILKKASAYFARNLT